MERGVWRPSRPKALLMARNTRRVWYHYLMSRPRNPHSRMNDAKAAVAYELSRAIRDGACLLTHRRQHSNRYPRVPFRLDGENIRAMPVHRLVMLVKEGPLPERGETRHLCGNSKCINPDHLVYGTMSDNHCDRKTHGAAGKKLTNEQVRSIRQRYVRGRNQASPGTSRALAQEFGVSTTQIRNIATSRQWAQLS